MKIPKKEILFLKGLQLAFLMYHAGDKKALDAIKKEVGFVSNTLGAIIARLEDGA